MAETPLIDPRTYDDLVAEVETLAAQYTKGSTAPGPGLAGLVLDQDVTDPAAGGAGSVTVAASGTLVDDALAGRIAAIAGLDSVQFRGWQPGSGDLGAALVRIFGRMAEQVVARLNKLPERSFLAFLDLIGTQLEPPQPARAPLTFALASGSPGDAVVPAGTQVAAAALPGEKDPPVFTTERDLTVTRSRLVAAFVRDPGRDRYTDATAIANGLLAGPFSPFSGQDLIAHRLYIGHRGLLASPEIKDAVVVRITPAAIDRPWLSAVDWEAWDGAAWRPLLGVTVVPEGVKGGAWRVIFPSLPPIPESTVAGVASSWLRGRLTTALPGGALTPAADGSGDQELRRACSPTAGFAVDPSSDTFQPLDLSGSFYPFGDHWFQPVFHLALGEPLDKPASQVEVAIDVANIQAPLGGGGGTSSSFSKLLPGKSIPTSGTPVGVTFKWEYWTAKGWAPLSWSFNPGKGALGGGVFLDSGTLRFARPDDWVATKIGDASGFWIRATAIPDAVTVSFLGGSGGTLKDIAYAPPIVTRVAAVSRWVLPRIDSVAVSAEISRSGLLPDLGFANQAPVDLSKDFFPFGEKPRVGDTFYLASEEALSKPAAAVSLQVSLTNPADPTALPPPAQPSSDLVLAWEFWNGQSWDVLGYSGPGAARRSLPNPYQVTDGTGGFKNDQGVVTFTCPPSLAPVAVGGKTGHFLRVRIWAGHYGLDATYQPSSLGQYQLVPATFRPPSIRAIQVYYEYSSPLLAPDFLVTENDFALEVTPGSLPDYTLLTPFTPPSDPRPTLYLGFERLGDNTGFANRPTALYFGVAPALYDPAAAPRTATEEAGVTWEYWNGSEWKRLGTRDETRAFSRRGLVTFVGPADFRASAEFGRTAFWLRARWERGFYTVDPELERVLLNTMWAVHARPIAGEVLGGSRGERDQVFKTTAVPVLAGQELVVVEPELPPPLEIAELLADGGDDAVRLVPATATQPLEIQVRWVEVPDFYGSGPRSRHYVLDRASGAVRFGDGRRGLVPPLGRGNLRLSYRSGGGVAGNRPAGNVNRLKGTVPYVAAAVLQSEPAEGGAAQESFERVQVRGPRALRHRDRAAAPADFEDLALAATTAVARVRCLPAHDGTDAGRVGLVVVPVSDLAQPKPDVAVLEEVHAYVAARLSPVVDLWTVGPDWLAVAVTVEIVAQSLEAATDVENAVRERLTAFLHPLTGGSDGEGWAFGRKPYRSDLYALIAGTPGVDHVARLEVLETAEEGLARPERFLVYSGDHTITLAGSTDEVVTGGAA